MDFTLEKFQQENLKEVLKTFSDSILNMDKNFYNNSQLKAWAEAAKNEDQWKERLSYNQTTIAVKEFKIIGFSVMNSLGCVDLLYVNTQYQKMGVGKALLKDMIDRANESNLFPLYTYASHFAKPFFEKFGFKAIRENQVLIDKISLTNHYMVAC